MSRANLEKRKRKPHQEHRVDALPPRIPHRAEPVPRDSARQQPGDIGDDEPQRPAAQPPEDTPKRLRRPALPISHPLLPQHLLEHIAKLLPLRLLPIPRRRRPAALAAREEVPRPRVRALRRPGPSPGLGRLGSVVVGGREGIGSGGGRPRVAAALEIVVVAAGGVGEGVVGVVDELELAGPGRALGTRGGDAVGMAFQGGAIKGCGKGFRLAMVY